MNTPIVIGALGGSGTRVFAQILQDCGVYIGSELNGPLDNITFSRLFRIPEYYSPDITQSINDRLDVFTKCMTNKPLSVKEIYAFIKANRKNKFYTNSLRYLKYLITSKESNDKWGWKAPLNQLYIKHLANYFPGMKYIQVVRNGYDMAFSENLNQLRIWGHLFDVNKESGVPSAQFEYWYHSNMQAIRLGKKLLGDNFKAINYEDFCMAPEKHIPDLLKFLDLDIDKSLLQKLTAYPSLPASHGRHKNQDYQFSEKEKEMFAEVYAAF